MPEGIVKSDRVRKEGERFSWTMRTRRKEGGSWKKGERGKHQKEPWKKRKENVEKEL